MTHLQFLITTNTLSTPLGERKEPSREYSAKVYSVQSSGQRLHKGYSMLLGNFNLVPIPVDIDTET